LKKCSQRKEDRKNYNLLDGFVTRTIHLVVAIEAISFAITLYSPSDACAVAG